MIDTSISKLTELYLHKIGTQDDPQHLELSERPIHLYDDKVKEQLLSYFKNIYSEIEWFAFLDKSEEKGSNEMYQISKQIFNQEEQYNFDSSVEIAKHLATKSTHPNIKSGELLIAKLEELIIHDEIVDALVVVKAENKQKFFKTKLVNGNPEIQLDEGLYTKKIDKACLILNTQAEDGYRLCIKDNASKGDTALFWKSEFLFAGLKMDDYQYTQVYMETTDQFLNQYEKTEGELDKTQEIKYKNRSAEYFNTSESFDWEDYKDQLFEDDEMKAEFEQFKSNKLSQSVKAMPDQFDISNASVEKNKKYFRSVIKLDKNFHIYVHGKRDMIEKGQDPNGRKYYKLYFNEEH